jgi:hypothetical protein
MRECRVHKIRVKIPALCAVKGVIEREKLEAEAEGRRRPECPIGVL